MSSSHSHFGLLHEIFVLDAYLKDSLDQEKMNEITHKLIDDLLRALRMEELGELQIYPAIDLRAPGWSFLQPITTSHIGGHYFEKPGKHPHIRLDIYSCCTVNWRKVIQVVHENLNLTEWRASFIDRQIEAGSERVILDVKGSGDDVLSETTLHLDRPEIATTVDHRNISIGKKVEEVKKEKASTT